MTDPATLLRSAQAYLDTPNAPVFAKFLIEDRSDMSAAWEQQKAQLLQRAQISKAAGRFSANHHTASAEQLAHVQFLLIRAQNSAEDAQAIVNHMSRSESEFRKRPPYSTSHQQGQYAAARQHAEFSPAPTKPDVMLSDQQGPALHHNWTDHSSSGKPTFNHVPQARPLQQSRPDYPANSSGYLGDPIQGSSHHTVNISRIRELLKQIDPEESMEPEVEEVGIFVDDGTSCVIGWIGLLGLLHNDQQTNMLVDALGNGG